MKFLLNQYGMRRIARNRKLRESGDDFNTDGGSMGGGGQNGDESGTGDDQNQNDQQQQGDKGKKQKSDDDLGFSDLMGGDDDEPLQLGDDDMNQGLDSVTEEEKAANVALGQSIQSAIGQWGFTEQDVPDNIDWSDKKQVASFLTKTNQASIAKSVQVIAPIITHALKTVVGKLETRIDRSVNRTATVTEAEKAFNGLGFAKGEDRNLARTMFNRGLKAKMTPTQAAAATRKAMQGLGKAGSPSGSNSGNGNRNQSSSGQKVGSAALDDIFG